MHDDQSSSAHVGVPKFDICLGPDADGTAAAQYRQLTELLYTLTFPPGAAARFRFHSVTYQLPRAVVASSESVAQTLSRGPAEIARGGDQILIWIQMSGESEVNYAGREGKLRPGDVAILDYAREIFARAPDFASIYVMIERNMVPPAFLAPSMHGTIFAADSGPGRNSLPRGRVPVRDNGYAHACGSERSPGCADHDGGRNARRRFGAPGSARVVRRSSVGQGAGLHRSQSRQVRSRASAAGKKPAVVALQPLSPVRAARWRAKRHSAAAPGARREGTTDQHCGKIAAALDRARSRIFVGGAV